MYCQCFVTFLTKCDQNKQFLFDWQISMCKQFLSTDLTFITTRSQYMGTFLSPTVSKILMACWFIKLYWIWIWIFYCSTEILQKVRTRCIIAYRGVFTLKYQIHKDTILQYYNIWSQIRHTCVTKNGIKNNPHKKHKWDKCSEKW